MRVGRSAGIFFLAASQKGTSSDIPPQIVGNFLYKQIFNVMKGESTYLLSHGLAAEIDPEAKGRCYTLSYGEVQFPFIPDKVLKRLFKDHVKPLKASCAFLDKDLITNYLEGVATKERYKNKRLTELSQGFGTVGFDPYLVIEIILESGGCEVEVIPRDSSEFSLYKISHIVTFPNGIRTAVSLRLNETIEKKHIKRLHEGMKYYKCLAGNIYTDARKIADKARKEVDGTNIELIDKEDFEDLSSRIEFALEKGEEIILNPNELADEEKEKVFYDEIFDEYDDYISGKDEINEADQLFNEMIKDDNKDKKMIEKKDDVDKTGDNIDKTKQKTENKQEESSLSMTEDLFSGFEDVITDSESENDEELFDNEETKKENDIESFKDEKSSLFEDVNVDEDESLEEDKIKNIDERIEKKYDINTKIKRVPVKKSFEINEDDHPFLIVHNLRTEEGEIFRTLMYVISDSKILAKYYIDKEINGEMDLDTAEKLGVKSKLSWNKDSSVLSSEEYIKELNSYLDNFNQSNKINSYVITWNKDSEFVKKYVIKKSDIFKQNPTIIENWYMNNFGIEVLNYKKLYNELKIKDNNNDFFNEIEKDYKLWTSLNS